ncbi:MAG: NUDIX domain-containing protein [bacterium]
MTRESSFGVIPLKSIGYDYSFLMIQDHNGHWGFPKGHSEGNEVELETAIRELKEETGIKQVSILHHKYFIDNYIFRFRSNVISKSVKYFIGILEDQPVNIQKKEVANYAWVSPQKALELLEFDGIKDITKEVILYINKNYTNIFK